jgi:hypothetical protein
LSISIPSPPEKHCAIHLLTFKGIDYLLEYRLKPGNLVAPPEDGKAGSKTRFPACLHRKVAKITRFRYQVSARTLRVKTRDARHAGKSQTSKTKRFQSSATCVLVTSTNNGCTVQVRQRLARVGTEGPHRAAQKSSGAVPDENSHLFEYR